MSKANEIQRTQTAILASQEYWEGPLPPPAVLRQYNETMPGAMERILTMAEREAAARHNYDATQLSNETLKIEVDRDDGKAYRREIRLGQIFAFIMVIFGITMTVVCAYLKEPLIAGILGGGTLANVVYAMLNAKGKQH